MGIPENHPAIIAAMQKGLIVTDVAPVPMPTAATTSGKPRTAKKPMQPPESRMTLTVTISPLRLASESNIGGKLTDKIARKLHVKTAVRAALPVMQFPLPVVVTLTRLGGKKLDRGNLENSFKAVQDMIAAWLGVDDADRRIRWRFRARPAYAMGCRITVKTRHI